MENNKTYVNGVGVVQVMKNPERTALQLIGAGARGDKKRWIAIDGAIRRAFDNSSEKKPMGTEEYQKAYDAAETVITTLGKAPSLEGRDDLLKVAMAFKSRIASEQVGNTC